MVRDFFFRIKDTYSYSFFMNCTVSFISVFHFKSRGRTDILDAKRRDRDHTPMNRFCFISFLFFINFVQQHKSQSCQGHEIYKSQVSMLKQISTLDHCLSKEWKLCTSVTLVACRRLWEGLSVSRLVSQSFHCQEEVKPRCGVAFVSAPAQCAWLVLSVKGACTFVDPFECLS